MTHRLHFKIADICLQLDSDLPFTQHTFHPRLRKFEIQDPQGEIIRIKHHFSLPDLDMKKLEAITVYHRPPWIICRDVSSWIYVMVSCLQDDYSLRQVSIANPSHTSIDIFHKDDTIFKKGNSTSLTFHPTDQMLISSTLADKSGCILHSGGVIVNGQGYLFLGHTEAGKSTIIKTLKPKAVILGDDRIVVRKQDTGIWIYGTWSRGDIPDISTDSAPLAAIFFINKSREIRIQVITKRWFIIKRFIPFLVRPLVTAEWWGKSLSLIEEISKTIPFYDLYFAPSNDIITLINDLDFE